MEVTNDSADLLLRHASCLPQLPFVRRRTPVARRLHRPTRLQDYTIPRDLNERADTKIAVHTAQFLLSWCTALGGPVQEVILTVIIPFGIPVQASGSPSRDHADLKGQSLRSTSPSRIGTGGRGGRSQTTGMASVAA